MLVRPEVPRARTGREAWYAVRPDTCACGMCVECRCGGRGAKCCRVPFYVRHPETRAKLDGGNAVFVDLWAGWAAEMCTRRDLYEMKFPAGATSAPEVHAAGLRAPHRPHRQRAGGDRSAPIRTPFPAHV